MSALLPCTKNHSIGWASLDASTMKVNSDKNVVPLYVIGGPATGEVPIINYVRSSVIQAEKLILISRCLIAKRKWGC